MKQKNKIAAFVAGMTVLSIGLVLISYFKFVQSHDVFPSDGFAFQTNEEQSDASVSMVFFSKGTPYRTSYPNTIRFEDKDGRKKIINGSSFLHLADGSFCALENGVLVDLSEASKGYINHYGISSDTILKFDGSNKYIPDGRDDIFQTGNFLYKISSDRYLYVAKDIQVTTPMDEEHFFSDFLEIDFPREGIVSFTSTEGTKQMSSNHTILTAGEYENRIWIDFTNKVLTTTAGTTLCLSDIDVDSEDNLSVACAMKIPYYEFSVMDGEKGKEGRSGKNGVNGHGGILGETGQTGTNGQDGMAGAPGEAGSIGGKGKRGLKGNNGENLIDGEVTDIMPTASFTDFRYSGKEMHAVVHFNAYTGLAESIKAILYQTKTGEQVQANTSIPIGIDIGDVHIDFTGLNEDTCYTLLIETDYSFTESGLNGRVVLLTREFTTNDSGIRTEMVYRNQSSLGLKVENNNSLQNADLRLELLDQAGTVLDSTDISLNTAESKQISFDGLLPNTDYFTKVSYYQLSDDTYHQVETIEGKTLKTPPTGMDAIIVAANVLSGTFQFALEGSVQDPDGAINDYGFEIYDQDGNMVKELSSKGTSPVTLYPDNQSIYEGINYSIRGRIDYYDNEKTMRIYTAFSPNTVMIIPNVSVDVAFTLVSIGIDSMQFHVTAVPVNTTLVADDLHPSIITISSPEYGTFTSQITQLGSDGTISEDVFQTNLYANMSYVVTISGYTDNLGDGNLTYNEWGSTTYKTSN